MVKGASLVSAMEKCNETNKFRGTNLEISCYNLKQFRALFQNSCSILFTHHIEQVAFITDGYDFFNYLLGNARHFGQLFNLRKLVAP